MLGLTLGNYHMIELWVGVLSLGPRAGEDDCVSLLSFPFPSVNAKVSESFLGSSDL